jgi:hypothetical protein
MAKVTNLTERTVLLHHWKVLPKGSRLLNPQGVEKDSMPDVLAYSPSGKHLADQGQLELEGYIPTALRAPVVEAPKEPKRKKREKSEFGQEE